MSLKEKMTAALTALFAKDKVEAADVESALATVEFGNAELDTKLAEFAARQIQADAEKKVTDLLIAGKIMPYEAAPLTALFAQATADDKADPTEVHFSNPLGEEQKVSRVEALDALFAGRTPHGLFEEAMQDPSRAEALFNTIQTARRDSNAPVTQERKDELLAKSDVGRQILAERRAGK